MTNLQASHTRVITREDPIAAVRPGKTISGLAYLKALQSGELPLPPFAAFMGMWITEVSEGQVVMAVEPSEAHYNHYGTVNGGVIATLLDSAPGGAVQTMLHAGTSYATLELRASYVLHITIKLG